MNYTAAAFLGQLLITLSNAILTNWLTSRRERRDRNREHERVADLERDLAVERAKREAAEQARRGPGRAHHRPALQPVDAGSRPTRAAT